MDIPTLVMFSYMTSMAQSQTGLEHDLIQKVAENEYNVMSPGAFLRFARFVLTDNLAYPRMVFSCSGDVALSYVRLKSVKSW